MTHALHDQIAATTRDSNGELPDLFDNTVHIVSEISDAIQNARWAIVAIACARSARQLDSMTRAHADLEKLLAQSTTMSQSLGKVLQFHAQRKAQS